MKSIRFLAISIVSGWLLTSCDWNTNQTVVGTGDVMSMEVELPDFEGVSVTGTCNVDIVTGETQSVELHAQQEILNVMTYEVKDHILHIGFKPDYTVNTTKEISASIVIPAVSHVSITGAGDFELEGAKQEVLDPAPVMCMSSTSCFAPSSSKSPAPVMDMCETVGITILAEISLLVFTV